MRFALAACLLLVGSVPVRAGALDPKLISADAKWFVHLDVDAAHQSPVLSKVREKMLERERVQKQLARLKEKFDFDPAEDLHSVTAYGTTLEPHRGVLIIKADVDQPVVIKQIKEKRGYESSTYNDHELHSLKMHRGPGRHRPGEHGHHAGRGDRDRDRDHGDFRQRDGRGDKPDRGGRERDGRRDEKRESSDQDRADRDNSSGDHPGRWPRDHGRPHHGEHRITLSFVKPGLVVLGHSTEAIKAALDVLDGKGSTLAPPAEQAPTGAIVQVSVQGLSELKGPFRSPLLTQSDRMSMWMSDGDGEVRIHKQVVMKSEEVANQIKAIAQGFRAMGQLRTSSDETLKTGFDHLKVESKGDTVTVNWQLSDAQTLEILAKLHAMHQRARGGWQHGHHGGRGPHHGPHHGPDGRHRPGADRPDGDGPDRGKPAASERSSESQ